MGWLEATVKIVTALAWPIVALAAVVLLRKQIAQMITRLTRLTGPAGIEAEFSEEVSATSELAEAAAPETPNELPAAVPSGQTTLVPKPSLADLVEEASKHPLGGMIRAWNLVEAVIPAFVQPGRRKHPHPNPRVLEESELVPDELFALASRLWELRNRVVHGTEVPSIKDANEYVLSAWRLAAALSRLVPDDRAPQVQPPS
ncbi:hypothetical protein KBX71_12085 [Micromonospora sp. D93]|uniref:hypothetical protein n=1 Tax=Micromonospora sp. D93 TaxID=2824886 RepID=UPI001B38448C|nr:hypothetical protein [Micromonospora sp. D93]MBQ1018596.1 hypothetical protein [Micromonospora sp. D93]